MRKEKDLHAQRSRDKGKGNATDHAMGNGEKSNRGREGGGRGQGWRQSANVTARGCDQSVFNRGGYSFQLIVYKQKPLLLVIETNAIRRLLLETTLLLPS